MRLVSLFLSLFFFLNFFIFFLTEYMCIVVWWKEDRMERWMVHGAPFVSLLIELSLGLQGDPTSPSERRSVLGVHWKD